MRGAKSKYGTEQGFAGGNDPANREDLWWSGYNQASPDYQWVRRLARIRRSYKALTHGDLKVTWASDRTCKESDAGIFAFKRAGGDAGDAYALMVFNTNSAQESSTQFNGAGMAVGAPGGTGLVNVLELCSLHLDHTARGVRECRGNLTRNYRHLQATLGLKRYPGILTPRGHDRLQSAALGDLRQNDHGLDEREVSSNALSRTGSEGEIASLGDALVESVRLKALRIGPIRRVTLGDIRTQQNERAFR